MRGRIGSINKDQIEKESDNSQGPQIFSLRKMAGRANTLVPIEKQVQDKINLKQDLSAKERATIHLNHGFLKVYQASERTRSTE